MKRIYTWDARPARRNLTAADLLELKGKKKLTQTTANTTEEALAAEEAGIDLIMGNAQNTEAVRLGSPNLFFTAAIAIPDHPTEKDILTAAFAALKAGADSIYTARGPHIVEMLAKEDIPVMCHLGLVPRKCTWKGGLRAVGSRPGEAMELWRSFRRMEDAGAFSVEAEVIPARLMTEISRRTRLITMSLGSGPGGDVIYLFQNDICGEQSLSPRHARSFGNLFELKETMKRERVKALKSFKKAVLSDHFPDKDEIALISDDNLAVFLNELARDSQKI